ncbi:MAG: hypothetical protein ACOVQX_07030 [Legionella sp.]
MGTSANSSDHHQEQPLTNNPAIAALEGLSQESSSSLSVEQLDTNSPHSGPAPVDNLLSSPTLSPSITPEKPAEYEAIELGRLPPSLQPQTKESQTTDHSIQIIPEDGSSITRSRATTNPVSEPLALFLKQMNISSDDFDSFELGMLNIIFSPKTWQQRVPTWVSLPSVSSLITKVAFYLSIRVQDLAAPGTTVANGTNITKHLSITGQAIPLYNQQAITRAYRINGFSNTISWVGSLWLLLYLSLQINAFILAVHDGQTDYSFRDIFFEPFDLSKLFTGSSQSTKASLANSVSSYYVWPFLIAIPLVAGVFSGWRYGKMAQSTNADSLELDIKQLKEYSPSARLDYWRWYLPKHPLSGPLKRISLYLRYQANIPDDAREKIFTTLVEFSAKAKGHTQLRAREVIASLTFAINPQDLVKAKAIFPDLDYTQTIKTMGKAYSNLNSAAFSLKPNDHENQLDALLRAGKTRYITHEQQLGYAGSFLALFILYDFYVSYGDLSLALIVLKGLINAFKNIDEMLKCKQANKVWSWRKESKIYVCSVCGDELQVAYRDIWTQETCVTAFMARTQPAQKIINFFQKHNLQGVTSLDFSAQLSTDYKVYHTAEELDAIFTVINQQLPMLNNFTFRGSNDALYLSIYPDSSYAGAPLGRFLANATRLKTVDFTYLLLQTNGTVALASYLPSTALTSLNLDTNIFGDEGINALIQALPQMNQLEQLNIMTCESSDNRVQSFINACLNHPKLTDITYGSTYISDATAETLALLLLKSNLTKFGFYGGSYTDIGLQFIAAQLPYAKNLTNLSIDYWSMTDPSTIYALSDALTQIPIQQLRLVGNSNELTVPGMGYFFYQLPFMRNLTHLIIGGSTCIDEASASDFGAYFPSSSISNFVMAYCSNQALSINATRQFSQGLIQSNLTSLNLKIVPLDNAFLGGLHQIIQMKQLELLRLTSNNLSEDFNLALTKELPHSQLKSLTINSASSSDRNGISDKVLNQTANLLLETKLTTINFGDDNYLSRYSIQYLFDKVIAENSNVESFIIYGSQLGDEGTKHIAAHLLTTHSRLRNINLVGCQITDLGAHYIANSLTRFTQNRLLWLDHLLLSDYSVVEPTTQLSFLGLGDNNITSKGAKEILAVIPQTNIPFVNVFLSGYNLTNADVANIAASVTSGASRSASIPWPVQLSYALLITLPHKLLSATHNYISNKEINDDSSCSYKELLTTILFALLAYQLISTSLKKITIPAARFGLFGRQPNQNMASEDTTIEIINYK